MLILIIIYVLLILGCVSSQNKTLSSKANVDLSKYNNIHLGWIDFKAEDWELYAYQDKESWENAIGRLNKKFQMQCKSYFVGKDVTASSNSENIPVKENILYIKFNNIHIDQFNYIVYTTIDFIDLSTNNTLLTIPDFPFYGKTVGFQNMLQSVLSEITILLKKELNIPDRKIVRVDYSSDSYGHFTKTVNANLSNYKNITIGWIDLSEDDWEFWGYGSKKLWAAVIKNFNEIFLKKCKEVMSSNNITGVIKNNSEPTSGKGLYVQFSNIEVVYNDYSLLCAIHFIDIETQKEIAQTPLIRFHQSNYGFERYLTGVLNLLSSQLNMELR